MRIAGFQPLSLLDFPERPCAVVFTQGCPLRCPFCHNPGLIPNGPGKMRADEVLSELERHANTVAAVCVTGGEPTVQPDLPAFLRLLKLRGFAVKLDTNGVHPRMVARLLSDRLVDYVAMDFKHRWSAYAGLTKAAAPAVEHIRRTFSLLQQSGVPHEFRTTVVPAFHTAEDLERMAVELAPGTSWAWQPVRYGITYDPNLPKGEMPPLEEIRSRILAAHPDLSITIRR